MVSGPTGWSKPIMAPSLGSTDLAATGGAPQGSLSQVVDAARGPVLQVGQDRTVVRRILSWYDDHARDLPWRRPDATPWAIMVSEFMLQQTPVERVRGPWQAWLERWPTPASLAAASPGDAVRAWGRLGYPRRALRLHQAARMITDDFNGQVPKDRDSLLRLPGVGSYTAAAIGKLRLRPSGDRSRYQCSPGARQSGIGRGFSLCYANKAGTRLSPSSSHRVRRIERHAGPLPRWSSALWYAALAVPAAMPAP